MARLPRLDLPGIPQHVVQRGNNRLPCFLDDEDRQRYLQLLLQAALATQCQLHAYVLMDNHVHLLTTPANTGAVSRMMQMLGRSYVARFNARHGRTGTLWEGRYKSCLVDSVGYVLTCYRYIELNPVRARMVESPDRFHWSSYAFNALGQPNALLTPHSCYQDLGSTNKQRAEAYRVIVGEALPQSTIDEIRLYLQQQRALGRAPSGAWSKPRPSTSPGLGRLIGPANTLLMPGSEPDPVFSPFFRFFAWSERRAVG